MMAMYQGANEVRNFAVLRTGSSESKIGLLTANFSYIERHCFEIEDFLKVSSIRT